MNIRTKTQTICDAYEQGYGKGQGNRDCKNPYKPGTRPYEAWDYGYLTGNERYKALQEAE
ncbi:MAG: hypothetical protein GY774_04410 [Planctomycetes bacterium]|nr:hypothetical protein [Planctomycetota bacterium]